MVHVKRITVWTLILIGSTVLFYLLANNQMYMIKSEEVVFVQPIYSTSTVSDLGL